MSCGLGGAGDFWGRGRRQLQPVRTVYGSPLLFFCKRATAKQERWGRVTRQPGFQQMERKREELLKICLRERLDRRRIRHNRATTNVEHLTDEAAAITGREQRRDSGCTGSTGSSGLMV